MTLLSVYTGKYKDEKRYVNDYRILEDCGSFIFSEEKLANHSSFKRGNIWKFVKNDTKSLNLKDDVFLK